MRTEHPKRVAVTGLGLVTPIGNDVEQSWANITGGKSGVGQITRFDAQGLKTTIAAEVKGFNAEEYLDRKNVRRYELFIQYAVAAAKQAVKDSAIDLSKILAGCSLGCGLGGLKTMEDNHAVLMSGRYDRISPFFIPMLIGNMAAGVVGIELSLKGPNLLTSTACAASTHAVGQAYLLIRNCGYKAMICGGAESVVTPLAVTGFNAMKAISTRNDEPQKASRPFDANRDGFVIGEGAGMMVLEEWEAAKERGAKIYAEVLGFGASCDAYHITAPPEDGSGAKDAMEAALKEAQQFRGLALSDIGYINAHGTSTSLNDISETKAIKAVFGPLAYKVPISSTKSMIGHLLGAAGGVEAIFTTLAIYHGLIPPTINLETPDPICDLDYVPNQARKAAIKAAMSNSFGFGGTNGVLLLGSAGDWD